jgi:hypothetical protein
MFTIDLLTLKILFFFALAIAFIFTERRYSFDFKDRVKIFISFFIIAYLGLIMGMVILSSVFEYLGSN